MRTLEVAKATAPLAVYAQKVSRGPVILTDGERPVAALLSLEDTDLETVTLSTNPQFLALIRTFASAQKIRGRNLGSRTAAPAGVEASCPPAIARLTSPWH